MPINPASGVPATAGLFRIVGADRDDVGAFFVQMVRQIVGEPNVSIGTFAKQMAIDPHLTIAHDAIERDLNELVLPTRLKRERFSVMTDAARIKPTLLAGGIAFLDRTFDAPVVRNLDTAPFGIIKRCLRGFREVPAFKAPARIETLLS